MKPLVDKCHSSRRVHMQQQHKITPTICMPNNKSPMPPSQKNCWPRNFEYVILWGRDNLNQHWLDYLDIICCPSGYEWVGLFLYMYLIWKLFRSFAKQSTWIRGWLNGLWYVYYTNIVTTIIIEGVFTSGISSKRGVGLKDRQLIKRLTCLLCAA